MAVCYGTCLDWYSLRGRLGLARQCTPHPPTLCAHEFTAAPTLETGNYRQVLASEVTAALGRAFGAEAEGADPMVTPATRPDFGDYQCNAALALAKRLKAKPRDVAVRARA